MSNPTQAGEKVVTDPFSNASGSIFARLEAIRAAHYKATSNSALKTSFSAPDSVAEGSLVETEVPTLIKTYVETLENSKFITGSPSDDLPDVNVGDLLEFNYYDVVDSVVEDIEGVCAYNSGNYSGYVANSSNFSSFFSDSSNFSFFFSNSSNFSGFNANSTFFSSHGSYANSGFCNPYSGCY